MQNRCLKSRACTHLWALWLYFIFFLFQFLQTTWNPTLESSGSISARRKEFSLSSQHTSSGVRAAMSIAVGMLTSCGGHLLLTAICMAGWAVTLGRELAQSGPDPRLQPQQWVPHTVLPQAVQKPFLAGKCLHLMQMGIPALGQSDDAKPRAFPQLSITPSRAVGRKDGSLMHLLFCAGNTFVEKDMVALSPQLDHRASRCNCPKVCGWFSFLGQSVWFDTFEVYMYTSDTTSSKVTHRALD